MLKVPSQIVKVETMSDKGVKIVVNETMSMIRTLTH
jgi:hypothetical protein